jgi:hypothetical protein
VNHVNFNRFAAMASILNSSQPWEKRLMLVEP